MLRLQKCFPVLFQCCPFSFGQCEIAESFPYIVYGLLGRVHHVFCIETVVPQLVHHQFVGREVGGVARPCHGGVHGEVESGFGQGVGVGAVREVPDWRDGEYELLIRV